MRFRDCSTSCLKWTSRLMMRFTLCGFLVLYHIFGRFSIYLYVTSWMKVLFGRFQ
ncbi:unnamed protein product [Brassica rapa]|uniref:Uncharacterized protein n=1 Tax=Brassica campestris TaxID=3711 RepID=A0A8D9M3J5_BRACM|nr:unnamed protein product [Brassica rapa]